MTAGRSSIKRGSFVTVTELSALLNRSPLSARQASERATELGVHLPYGTAASYWAGSHPANPQDRTLQAIAEVTGIPVTRLRAAIKVGVGELGAWTPPAEANRLNNRQRAAINELIRSIVDAPAHIAVGGTVDDDDWTVEGLAP